MILFSWSLRNMKLFTESLLDVLKLIPRLLSFVHFPHRTFYSLSVLFRICYFFFLISPTISSFFSCHQTVIVTHRYVLICFYFVYIEIYNEGQNVCILRHN